MTAAATKAPALTKDEEEGVKCIIALQETAGVKETRKKALAGWRAMSPGDRLQTVLAYRAVIGRDPSIVATPKRRRG